MVAVPPPPPDAGGGRPPAPFAAGRRGRTRLIIGLSVVALVLVAGGVGLGYLAFHQAGTSVATTNGRPTPTVTAAPDTASAAPNATPSPAGGGAPTMADLTNVANALFPQTEAGGRNTCFQGDTTFAQCQVTDRLRAALKAAVAAQSGAGGADPICGCQNLDQSLTFSYTASPNGVGGTIHVRSFGGSSREDIVVVSQGGVFLADDLIYCTANPPSSIYPNEGAMC